MRDNRHKWSFIKHPAKETLTAHEVSYWKTSLSRLLKIGIEFEFNLPEQKGTCKGTNVHCPCSKIEKGCWKECINIDKCTSTAYFDTCGAKTAQCKRSKCAKCDKYVFKCLSTNCIEFVSKCFSCAEFSRSCEACGKKYNPDKDPSRIRDVFQETLLPSNSYRKTNKSGVVSITTDGSLAGDKGAEIITIGRRVDYWEFYYMVAKILQLASSHGAYVNERCSSHMHLLTSYYDNDGDSSVGVNELEKDIPEIIMANFHQLCRKYQNAITWMTMALDKPEALTRWEKFRVSILDVSSIIRSMSDVNREVMSKSATMSGNGKEKYGWVNYMNTRFKDGKINKFHVEMRVSDSTMCPSFYASIACLFYALIIKAVDMSRYGVLNIGDNEWLTKATEIKNNMMNNGNLAYDAKRLSNTSNLLSYKEELVAQSMDLLEQTKGILIRLGPAYEVLTRLAKEPIALRRVNGYSWEQIEKDICAPLRNYNRVEMIMSEIIDLNYISECHSQEEWIEEVSKISTDMAAGDNSVKLSKEDIVEYINIKQRDGELIWSSSVGAIINI